MLDKPVRLYLDLLKASLTDTLFTAEPDPDNPSAAQFLEGFRRHYIDGNAITMLPLRRLDQLEAAILDAVHSDIAGDLVEAGVWRGGSTIFMRGILAALDISDRLVWVADSFEGLPLPDPASCPREAQAHDGPVMRSYQHLAAGLDEVKRNFAAYHLLDSQVRFLKGWFADTLPDAGIERIAVLRLDADYYQSTLDVLNSLYDRVSPGGYVIIDDYGETAWTHCREAIEEFRAARAITAPLIPVDKQCSYWRK